MLFLKQRCFNILKYSPKKKQKNLHRYKIFIDFQELLNCSVVCCIATYIQKKIRIWILLRCVVAIALNLQYFGHRCNDLANNMDIGFMLILRLFFNSSSSMYYVVIYILIWHREHNINPSLTAVIHVSMWSCHTFQQLKNVTIMKYK